MRKSVLVILLTVMGAGCGPAVCGVPYDESPEGPVVPVMSVEAIVTTSKDPNGSCDSWGCSNTVYSAPLFDVTEEGWVLDDGPWKNREDGCQFEVKDGRVHSS